MKFSELSMHQLDLPLTFCTSVLASVNICHLSMHLRELPSTFINVWGAHGTFRELSVHPQDLPSTFVNFLCIRGTFRQLPSTFRASAELFADYFHFFVYPLDLLSTFCVST